MKATKKNLAQQFQSLDSMAIQLREMIAEASRQFEDGHVINAFVLIQSIWPAVVYCAHRRFTGAGRPRARRSTMLITGMSTGGLPAAVVAKMQEADVAAVMGGSTPGNASVLIAASVAALDATETATMRRPAPKVKAKVRRRPALFRWMTSTAG